MIIIVRNIIRSSIQKSWTLAKQTDDMYKKTLRKKETSRAPNLYTYRDKNKDRYHTINSRECCKSTKNPQLALARRIHNILILVTPQTTKRISYYQMLLQSVCTKCRVQTAHRRCWTVLSRPINISALMMRIKRKLSRSC